MKKIILLSSVAVLLTSYAANAQIAVVIGSPAPVYYAAPVPGYIMAPDWPSEHYDHHRHRHNDYWAHREQEERNYRAHDEHDNGNHGHR